MSETKRRGVGKGKEGQEVMERKKIITRKGKKGGRS